MKKAKDRKRQSLQEKNEEHTKKHRVNVISAHTYPSGWLFEEIETAKGRKCKRYTSPRGYQHFSKKMAVGAGVEDDKHDK